MKLEQLIGEATEYDKKVMLEVKKPKSWLKSVSAFANGVGGVLIFGIADDDSVVGIDDVKKAMEVISEQIKVKMDPTFVKSASCRWQGNRNFGSISGRRDTLLLCR